MIKEAREAAGMTQRELAIAADCSRSTIAKLEAGARAPTTKAARTVCAVLGIPAAELPAGRKHTIHAEVSPAAWSVWQSWPAGTRGRRLSEALADRQRDPDDAEGTEG